VGVYGLKSAKALSQASQLNYQNTIDNVIVKVVEVYQNVITARQLFNLALQKENLAKKITEQAKIKLSLGAITKTDMLQAQANLAATTAQKEAYFASQQDAEENFNYTIGVQPPKDLDTIKINALTLPKNFEEFITKTKQNNLMLKIMEKKVLGMNLSSKAAKASLMPNLSVQGQAFQTSGPDPFLGLTRSSKGQNYSLSIAVPIFSGQQYSQIAQSILKYEETKNEHTATVLQIHKNATKFWNDYQYNQLMYKATNDNVEYSQGYFQGAETEFKIGTKNMMDLLDAQIRYEEAKVSAIKNKAAIILASFLIKYMEGDIQTINFADL
jgi:outer membrane protein